MGVINVILKIVTHLAHALFCFLIVYVNDACSYPMFLLMLASDGVYTFMTVYTKM